MQRPTVLSASGRRDREARPGGTAGRHHRAARPGCMASSGGLCIRGLVRPTSRGNRGSEDGPPPGITLGRGGPGGDSRRYGADTGPKSPGPHIWPRGGHGGPARAGRVASIRASSAGWRPQHHTHDEQDEEESHDERERPHVPWMCRLHDAPPPSLSNRIPGRFATSIDARDGPRVARAAWRRGHRNGVSRRGCSRGPGWRRARPGWPSAGRCR